MKERERAHHPKGVAFVRPTDRRDGPTGSLGRARILGRRKAVTATLRDAGKWGVMEERERGAQKVG